MDVRPLFRPIGSATGRACAWLAAIAVITFASPFIPDATAFIR